MNNNTKIRLRLSKNLFESLTREILAEAKVNDGYSVAVKQPKAPKESKAQKSSPEVVETDGMKKEAAPTPTGNSASKLGADMIKKGQAVKSTSGLSGQEIKTIQSILDLIVNKAPEGETALALQKALTILTQNTKNIEDKGQSGAPALPKAPAMPGLKEKKMKEMETKVAEGDIEEGYYDDIKGYTSVRDNGTGFKDNDRVKSKSTGQEGVVYDILQSTDGKALVVVKFEKNGQKTISKYGEEFNDIADIEKK